MKLLQLSGAHERDAIYFPIEKYAATWAQDLFRHRETHMGARFYKCPNCGKSSFNINQLHDIDHSKSGYISSSTQRRSGVLIKLHILFRRAKRYLLGVGILKKNMTVQLIFLYCFSGEKYFLTTMLGSIHLWNRERGESGTNSSATDNLPGSPDMIWEMSLLRRNLLIFV